VGAGNNVEPISENWSRPFLFKVDDLPAEGLSDLHLRFDLIGPGEVWIDDVKLVDLPFEHKECTELTKLIALADLKLKGKQLADCSQLLDGYWPHFLLAHVSLTETPALVAEKPPSRERPAEPAKKPARWRDYLQKIW
jgi:hypothetical protein